MNMQDAPLAKQIEELSTASLASPRLMIRI
jgi:hypothetical protein